MLKISAKNETLCNKKILMLEGAPEYKPQSRSKYSNRVSAINKQSIKLLKSINAWDFIETVRYKPILEMQVCLHSCFILEFIYFAIFIYK